MRLPVVCERSVHHYEESLVMLLLLYKRQLSFRSMCCGKGLCAHCLIHVVCFMGRCAGNKCQRVAIFDFDVHHGNGTAEQAVLREDGCVLYLSTHQVSSESYIILLYHRYVNSRQRAGAAYRYLSLKQPNQWRACVHAASVLSRHR